MCDEGFLGAGTAIPAPDNIKNPAKGLNIGARKALELGM
jgi:hypothetical protein